MALLLDIRRLDPFRDPDPLLAASGPPDRGEKAQSCFRNLAYRDDADSDYLAVDGASTRSISSISNNQSSSSLVRMVTSSADSGIQVSGGKSLDPGAYEKGPPRDAPPFKERESLATICIQLLAANQLEVIRQPRPWSTSGTGAFINVPCFGWDVKPFFGWDVKPFFGWDVKPFFGWDVKPFVPSPIAPCFSNQTKYKVFVPFLIAGIGTCGAGVVLSDVEKWEVFEKVTELFVLVPTLLGLKGNLEMTLASRVSTQANLGKLDTWQEQWQMSWGNMALIQCQATVMSFLASGFATAMSLAGRGFQLDHALLVTASALCTAAAASLILGAVTLAVVVASHKLHVNPDNVATPIASSLGDVTTLGLLAASSSALYKIRGNLLCSSVLVGVFMLLVPVWAYLSHRNPFVRQVLYTGWLPVIIAVVITSAGGFILEFSIREFKGIAVFQPVINGVAGNLVAVQASRISTYFHRHCSPGDRPPDGAPVCVSPFAAFCGKSEHARTARLLLAMVVPGHLLFGYGVTLAVGGGTALTPSFLPIYLAAAFVQIAVLLYVAHCLVQVLWRFKVDPDNSAIPLLTALGDLSGMACLSLAFYAHAAAWPTP